jgi:hypothetical protein
VVEHRLPGDVGLLGDLVDGGCLVALAGEQAQGGGEQPGTHPVTLSLPPSSRHRSTFHQY